jgi:hemolysin activation/secretion protein
MILPRPLGRLACVAAPVLCGAWLAGAPASAQDAAPPPADPAAAVSPAPEQRLDIEAYDVEGNTLLDELTIQKAVYDHLGPQRTAADVDKAREALEAAYKARGYQSVVVDIPAQSVAAGPLVVKLRVTEAQIGRLRVVGSKYHAPSMLKGLTPSLAEGQVPNLDAAQREVAELNRLPTTQVTPILRPGKIPGTVDVDLKVSDELPLKGSLELNNDHAPNTDPLRLVASLSYNNLWQQGHTVSATYLVAPQDIDAAQVIAGSYLAPVLGTPWSLLVYAYDSNSNVASLGGTTVLGKGYAIGVRGILQLPSFGSFTHSVNFGADFKHFDEAVKLGDDVAETPIEYWPANAVYSLNRVVDRYTATASLGVTLGVRGFGSDRSDFEMKRFDATANFVKLNLDASLTYNLGKDVVAAAKISGQLSDQPLVSSEQFAIGGLTSVRGYLQSEGVGDNGILGSLELRSPSVATFLGPWVDELRLYGFTEAGKVWTLEALAGQQGRTTLYTVGLGLRLQTLGHFRGDVAVALPLRDSGFTDAFDPYLTFIVRSEF